MIFVVLPVSFAFLSVVFVWLAARLLRWGTRGIVGRLTPVILASLSFVILSFLCKSLRAWRGPSVLLLTGPVLWSAARHSTELTGGDGAEAQSRSMEHPHNLDGPFSAVSTPNFRGSWGCGKRSQ